MDQILNEILKDTFTLGSFKSRSRALKSLLLKEFFGGEIAQSTDDLNWLSSLPKTLYQQFTKDNVYKVFEELEKAVATIPLLTIHLTFEPNEITIDQIGVFARKTFFPLLLLDIKLDPNLIAGCSLIWKGRQKDYSLRSKMEEKKPEILNSFKQFLR